MVEGDIWLRETYVDAFGPRNVVPTDDLIPLVYEGFMAC